MRSPVLDAAGLRSWLVDYLITHIGCSPESIDFDASMADLGVGSKDAVVLSGELAELLGRTVSPVDFWQHPTINGLLGFLSTPVSETEAEAVVPASDVSGTEPIAVIGLGCRMPGGISDADAFWQFLADGRCAVGEVPAERWQPFDDGSPETASALSRTTRWGSFLEDVEGFDADFFDISPREAVKMDPQQRLLLEVAWEALEHAGIPAASLRRSQTGVFAGACFSEYGYLASTDLPRVDAWSNTGGALSIIANRLSYFLDLRGPSITVDTACSSSLVAVHLACQSLRSGDSNLAIAAGVNLLLSPAVFHGFDQAGALSPTGMCHAFDAATDGFVRGEGCGVVILKRLPDALRDGDRILAVVRGSAINQDGRSNGLMAPNPAAQMAVLRTACAHAGIEPQDLDYVEAHGTGTFLGDPIEARALGSVMGRGRPAGSPLLIGAVKSNLGHLEAAAGVAGFIKTVMALQRGRIPGNVGYQSPNPHIPFDQLRLKVVDREQEWPTVTRARRAGVSSFGFGGTNAHVILEQAPDVVAVEPTPAAAVNTLVISGKSTERIGVTAAALAEWMVGPGAGVGLAEVAHTLNHHRAHHPAFATVCARDGLDAVAGLQALAAGHAATGVVLPHDGPCGSGTVLVFSGQGSQWAGMGRRLLVDEPVFAAAVDELEPVFVEQVGFSLRQVLAGGEAVAGDARVQPVIMGLQLALTELWRAYGVSPDAVIGHSMGEVTAAVVAGALSVRDGLRVIAVRSRLMSRLAGQGAVALLTLGADAAESSIADHPGVEIAGYVSPGQTVVAGPPERVEAVIAAAQAQNRFARRVNMEVASHTALMDPILAELRAELADLTPNTTAIPFISTVDDSTTAPLLDADYWVANVRRPVRLSQAFLTAAENHTTFVEISAHPMLTNAVTETLGEVHHHALGTLSRDTDDTVTFHTNLNATHTTHPPLTPHPHEPHPVLPATPWQHTRHWMDLSAPRRISTSHGDSATAAGVVPAEWNCELAWPPRPITDARPATGSWLVVGDAQLAGGLRRELGDEAAVGVLDDTTDDIGLEAALATADHVLFAPAVPAVFDAASGHRLFATARRIAVAMARTPEPGRLFLLTRNAQPVSEGDRANPGHAVLWGLGRTLALEHPEIWGAAIDLDELVPGRLATRCVLAEAASDDGEDQVVYRAGVRRVARLRRAVPPQASGDGVDPNGSHLVVGATGNIGPYLIQQLADMGAKTVVAVSRNPGNRLQALADTLAARGTTLVTVAADAADETAMAAVFDRFGADLPPLAGIYLAAFGGGPVTLAEMTDEDVTAMFAPKLDAVSVLHDLSLATDVQQFVLFSSVSGLLGSRWLAHYTATTTFLDTFAYARRAAGLPATAVNWGLWKSLADNHSEHERQVTLESGLEPMPDEVAIQALWTATAPGAPARSTVVAADWPRLAAAYRTRAALRIVDELLPVESVDEDSADTSVAVRETEFRRNLRVCPADERERMLSAHVRALVASSMGLANAQLVDPSAGFFQCGMDSLMSVTLKRALGESLGQTLPASVIFDYPTVDGLTEYLATVLPELIEVAEADDTDDYDEFSDDELLQQLSERLS
ncbi:polyketide synthase [Mycolicibacterium litorale]|uniref:Polyketide synthase n=1 Tax=Mycolicibacterium litorale TaxID=758802 RepID=A0A6S6PBA3_9MYCO|nr:type I polyketide synthase [Mycolicibacterium litorale]BCI53468.1 polyketide synthase [Mycolicibacterium litorale]